MRDIKFRVWARDTGYFAKKGQKKFYHITMRDCLMSPQVIGHLQEYFPMIDLDSEEYVVQQYTGLKDKNGKGIYEGDIVKTWFAEGGVVTYIPCQFIVANSNHHFKYNPDWEHPSATFPLYRMHLGVETEIIGNIYENPELLEKIEEKDEK